MSGIEQRRHPRIEVNWPATATSDSGYKIDGLVIDASEGGIGFISNEACTAGETFHLAICVSPPSISRHHVVARYKSVHSRTIASSQGNFLTGMQLQAIEPEDFSSLIRGLFENARNTLYL